MHCHTPVCEGAVRRIRQRLASEKDPSDMIPHMTSWPEGLLAEVAEIERRAISPTEIMDGTLYVGLEHMDSAGGFVDVRPVQAGDLASTKFRFTPDHILYGKLRPYLAKIARPDFAGVCSTDILPIRPGPKLDRGFLYHFLRQPRIVDLATAHCSGANLPRLSPRHLAEFRVPLPPLSEQKRIAGMLDRADAIRRKRRQAVAMANSLVPAAFLDMFGDPVSNSRSWPGVPLETLGEVITGNTPSRKVKEYYGEGIEWIKSDNINTPSHFLTRAAEELSDAGMAVARIAPAGSTLVTCIAGSPSCIGNAALADRDVAFNQQINAISPRQGVDPYFLYGLILTSKCRIQESSTASMKGMVSKSAFCAIRTIDIPADLQAEFGRRFLAIVGMERLQAKSAEESEALFSALVQRAFHGILKPMISSQRE